MRLNRLVGLLLLIFTLNALFGFTAHAAFSENSRRYLSPRDVFNVMAQKFPVVADRVKIKAAGLEQGCWAITKANENVIGVVNPAIGKAAAELPPPGFVRWFGSCAHKIVEMQLNDLFLVQHTNEKLWAKYFPKNILNNYRDPANKIDPYHKLADGNTWGKLTPEEQDGIIRFNVTEMIGPESVIHDLGYAKDLNAVTAAIANTIQQGQAIQDALHNILLATAMREEFLTY